MKNLLAILGLLLFVGITQLKAQNNTLYNPPAVTQTLGDGFNGTNFMDITSPKQFQFIVTWIPKGDTLVIRARFDKELGHSPFLDEWKDLNELFRDSGRVLLMIFTANMYDTPDNNLYNLDWVLDNGLKVIAVELGNEMYSQEQANMNFITYQNLFEPFTEAVEALYPNMPITVFAAPRPAGAGINGGRGDHKKFNDDLATYMRGAPLNWGISDHIYINNKEIPYMDTAIVAKTILPGVAYSDLTVSYLKLLNPVLNGSALKLYDSTITYLRKQFPNRKYYITEFQYNNSATYKNTLWNGMATFIMWNYTTKFKDCYFLEHNGKGNTIAANISNRDDRRDLDVYADTQTLRVNYFVYKLFKEYPDGSPKMDSYELTGDTTYYFWFTNMGSSYIPNLSIPNYLRIDDLKVRYIQGEWLGSSSGVIGQMTKTSPASYEITGIEESNSFMVPGMSLGYLKISLKNNYIYGCMDTSYFEYNPEANFNQGCNTKKVWGCTDTSYLNYNPLANINSGCQTKKVYGCTDPLAKNYNPQANVDNGSCCYKKWYQLFKKCPRTQILISNTKTTYR